MRRTGSRVLLLAVSCLLLVPLTPRTAPAAAQDLAAQFAEALAARDSTASLAGPTSGDLVQQENVIATAGAGVSVADFSATATFINPTDGADTPWDIGFSFHSTPSDVEQIAVDSTGTWYYTPYPAGVVQSGSDPSFDAAPGGTNTIDLVVDGAQALFGLNGHFVASFDLPPSAASDVQVGTGYFTTTTTANRVVGYQDFQVWPLAAVQAQTPTSGPIPFETPTAGPIEVESATPAVIAIETPPAPSAVATPAATPAISAEAAAQFTSLLASQAQVAPAAGPFTANLKEFQGQVGLSFANVNFVDFSASAVVDAPAESSDVPWNVGFQFRISPAGEFRVSVSSLETWYFSVGAGGPSTTGPISGLLTTPGASNTLDLVVQGQTAWLGINGALAAMVELPADGAAADVALGAGFFNDQSLPLRVTPFRDFVVRPLGQSANATPVPTGGLAPEDVSRFQSLINESGTVAPSAGPFSGRLVEATVGSVPMAAAGVSLTDFGAVATFTNPANPTDAVYDAGFQFWVGNGVADRIVVDSLGDVYAAVTGQNAQKIGSASTYDASAGGSNTLALFVEGSRALLGVNGELVAAADLPGTPVASDVQIGSGFFNEDFLVGRVTDYRDFAVWEIA
jgi:hypothetical protein